ncbi:MAG: helix-turn-helix transcriptional regulator, partial [Verrucomicrobia bacterium]|nr:helix-turn-helix transcriptional regulator [Verrucomicrobiota bacterium]
SPSRLKEGYFFLDYDGNYKKYMDSVSQAYPLYHPLLIIKKEGSKAHLFGFASKKPMPALPSLYLNGLPMLNSFIHHYLQSQKPLDPILDIAQLRGQKNFYGKTYGEESLLGQTTNTLLLTQLGVPKILIHSAQTLTNREKEVLNAYLDHKSAKEHGQELGLSYRTIQSYIVNIKNKLGVLTRDELLEQGTRLKMAGFLHTTN